MNLDLMPLWILGGKSMVLDFQLAAFRKGKNHCLWICPILEQLPLDIGMEIEESVIDCNIIIANLTTLLCFYSQHLVGIFIGHHTQITLVL